MITDVCDVLRVYVIVFGVAMLGLFLEVARDVRNTRQYGMYALVCLGTSAISTSVQHFGWGMTAQLPLNVLGVTLGLVFLWRTHHDVHGSSARPTA